MPYTEEHKQDVEEGCGIRLNIFFIAKVLFFLWKVLTYRGY